MLGRRWLPQWLSCDARAALDLRNWGLHNTDSIG
jgi:hypothetical protein